MTQQSFQVAMQNLH